MNDPHKAIEKDDDFIVIRNFKSLPKGITFYYSFGFCNALQPRRAYVKVTKTHCWDGGDKLRATNPSVLDCIVRVPRFLYESYCQMRKHGIDSEELINITLNHQNKLNQ